MFFDKDEKDDFWDVEKLIPKKKKTIYPFSTKEKTVDFTVAGEGERDTEKTKLTNMPTVSEDENSTAYTLNSGLIRRVRIKRFVDKFDFYGNFRKAALVYYDFKTPKCDFVPFYSYMPQYSQFNLQQKNFYFYFRDCVRRGKYIKTDYSYLYLYVYEILNLPDKISPKEGLKLLISLWKGYRTELPNIDSNFSLWVQDYCLVYNLPCPIDEIKSFIFDVIGSSDFKEFYLSDIRTMGIDGINALLACLSDYDWRSGKYAGGENRELYARHLLGAMGALLTELWQNGEIVSDKLESATISRSAFRNSLCTHEVKCRLEIEYIPLSKAQNLRNAVTGALRYTENKLRALLGVKSRLSIKELPDMYMDIIDFYFSDILKKAEAEKRKAEMPEYEKLYDADDRGLSFEGADEIEKASWITTQRLVEDADEEFFEPLEEKIESTQEIKTESAPENTYGLSECEINYLYALKNSDREYALSCAEKAQMTEDALTDKINEAFSDGFGDVIIECIDGEYVIIEDYFEDLEKWLTKIMK